MEESNTVNNTPRELVRLICIAGMLPDPDTHPSGTDLCSSHFSARMSWGVRFPPKIYPAPPHLVRDKMPRGVSLIQYTTQNTKGSLKCKVWGTGTGKGLDCREDVDGRYEQSLPGEGRIHWAWSLPLVLPALSRMGGSSWIFISEKGNKKEIRCYHFHFVIERKPWYIRHSFTADAVLTNSTKVAEWQLCYWWYNLLVLLLPKVFPTRS